MSPRPTVVVVDDDEVVRLGIERLLAGFGYEVRLHATAEEYLGRGRPDGPSCLLLDVRMPGMDGLDLQEELERMGETLPVVFLTGLAGVPESVLAMKRGAVDFLQKPVDRDELHRATEHALERDREDQARRTRRGRVEALYATLTPRESQVFEHVVRGLLNKQIAIELGTTEKTIKVHRGQVMRKMQAESLPHLVRLAGMLGVGEAVA